MRHPTEPGTYLLGVECDGATYHSSKVARDRDRLRQQVLEGLGWKIHRIWSTAWFSDRATEEERLKRALEAALQRDDMSVVERVQALDIDVLVEEHDFDQAPEWTEEYREPVASAPQVGSEFTDARSRREISSQILEVVTTSGPIHEDDVLDTIRVAWGLGPAGRLIREAFHKALASLRTKGDVEIIAGFVSTTGSSIVVRVPAEHAEIVRKVTAVDPRELELAIKLLLADASGASSAELRQAWARLFGWRRIGADIEDAFEQTLRRLKSASIVVGDDRLELAD